MDGQIFGSNVSLPSLPGLKSGCEEELLLLMSEIDTEFQRKHYELLGELLNLRTLCKDQSDQIEALTNVLSNDQNENLIEKIKQQSMEYEKLTKENEMLKSENRTLQHKVKRLPDLEHQLKSLERSLSIQQDENKDLNEKLLKSEERYLSLVSNVTIPVWQSDAVHNVRSQGDASNSKEEVIAKISEQFMSEEKKFSNVLHSGVNQHIENFDKNFREAIDED